jgi:hypothetical protein
VTAPSPSTPRPREWWTRPRVVLPIVGAIVVLAALLTPQVSVGRVGDSRLTSHQSGAMGARVLFRLAERLGFASSSRDTTPIPAGVPNGRTIHAVLAPILPVSATEAHAYLDAVRAGDALLVVLDHRDALSDSLGVSHTRDGGILHIQTADSAGCRGSTELVPPLWPDGLVHLYALRWIRGEPDAHVEFATLIRRDLTHGMQEGDAAVGFALGRGRVAVVADPDLLRSDVLRRCRWGADAVAARMLEWLRAGGTAPRTALVFDEYHQGFGPQPSLSRVVWRFLVGNPVGRTLLALAVAGLVLIAATGARPLVPIDDETVERRDPLEQVDALAHAYEQVGATRTITARLLRGVRTRAEGPGSLTRARRDDDAFLSDVEVRAPELAADVALVRRALRETIPTRDLTRIGAALRRIEESLTTTHA